MYMLNALMQAVRGAGDDGLTWAEVLHDIPHDLPALVIYALTLGAVGWVVWANRKRPGGPASPA